MKPTKEMLQREWDSENDIKEQIDYYHTKLMQNLCADEERDMSFELSEHKRLKKLYEQINNQGERKQNRQVGTNPTPICKKAKRSKVHSSRDC